MTSLPSLAIVAGGGVLPALVAQKASAQGTKVFIIHLDGSSDHFLGYDGITVRPEQLGKIFATLRAQNIRDIVMIGRMSRPSLLSLRPDFETLRVLPPIAWALCFGGDDALLKSVRRMIEGKGFSLHGVQEFVEEVMAPAGPFGAHSPQAKHLNDIHIGMDAARSHGAADRGQAVVVWEGQIVAREGRDGTDAMIRKHPMQGAVLVKTSKPGQDMALDMPSIGPGTVDACMASGYAGIAVEAGMTLVANRDETIARADQAGIFLMGIS